jgi:hypothetical protein
MRWKEKEERRGMGKAKGKSVRKKEGELTSLSPTRSYMDVFPDQRCSRLIKQYFANPGGRVTPEELAAAVEGRCEKCSRKLCSRSYSD